MPSPKAPTVGVQAVLLFAGEAKSHAKRELIQISDRLSTTLTKPEDKRTIVRWDLLDDIRMKQQFAINLKVADQALTLFASNKFRILSG